MLDVIRSLMKGGFKTSEFWLSLVALCIPFIDHIVTHWVDVLNGIQHAAATPGWESLLAGVAAAIVAAAYSFGRSLVKAKGVQATANASLAAIAPAYAPGDLTATGNEVTAGPGANPSRVGAAAVATNTGMGR